VNKVNDFVNFLFRKAEVKRLKRPEIGNVVHFGTNGAIESKEEHLCILWWVGSKHYVIGHVLEVARCYESFK